MENLYNLSRLCTVRPPVKISASDRRGESRPAWMSKSVYEFDLKSNGLKVRAGSIPAPGTLYFVFFISIGFSTFT